MKITKGERRFLILWLATWSFAFFVNLADIKGELLNNSTPQYLFTKNNKEYQSDFFPFTTFVKNDELKPEKAWSNPYLSERYTCFNGLFNSFNLVEWLVFCTIGTAIVFVPKIW